ncbi:TonB-dependent receptor [Prevotella sp. 10(H)]|uniref:SusC/RagA family TonB-linked outer membrane protein n=1 Tax=Prevotella sp. 10(H) TaxID=1158294 RepID=UPI0004A6BC95|nr:TonB-dependent receptor [Prevotella sp. 10(H)]
MKKIIYIFLSLLFSASVSAQTMKSVNITGKVLDENDAPMTGATVSLKDRPGVGSFADAEGVFKIKASVGDILLVTMIGYNNFEYLIKQEESELLIKMSPASQQLAETVVTGVGGSQRRISIVGAVTTVDVEQLQTPATSLPNMLGGRVAGVITRQSSGEPGKNISDFWIRGIGTFGANDKALVLIDGLEGNLNTIDPADIENFSVLKDASATAVYGVRGANGVILVTTKRGTTDKLRISARANLTVSHLNRMPEYLGAYDYAVLANEAKVMRGDDPLYSDAELYIIKNRMDPDLYPDVDWRDEIINKTSLQQTYYINARGGGSLANYFVSLGLSNEDAAYKQDKTSKYNSGVGFKQYTYRANIEMNLTKTTKLFFGVDGWYNRKKDPGIGDTNRLWLSQMRLTPLLIPTQYSNGKIPAFATGDADYSPYVMLNHTGLINKENSNNTLTLTLNQDLSFLLKGLSIRAQGALTQENYFEEKRWVRPELWRALGREVNGQLKMKKIFEKENATYGNSQWQKRKYHFESTVNYDNIFAEDHRAGALLYYYMSDAKETFEGEKSSMQALPYRYQGLSGRLTYSFKDTYFLHLNFGYTGSANFKKGSRFGFFPAIAGGWIPTQYEFMKNAFPWLSHLKIRGSYGLVGNDRITDKRFPYLTTIKDDAGTGWGFNDKGIKEEYIGADNLVWEKAKKLDIGVEAQFLNQNIELTVDYFKDQRDGIFQERVQIPGYVGLNNMPFGNVGRMKSWGMDGNISFNHNINKDMGFTIRANFTYATNEIQDWEKGFDKYPYQDYKGWPHHVRRGYICLGLFRDEDDVKNSPFHDTGSKILPGDLKYKDVNGDGIVNDDDQVPISYSDLPRLMFGFGGEFRYKNFTLNVLFKGTGRTDFYWTQKDWGLGYIPFERGEFGNVLKIANDPANRWTPASYSGTKDTENPNARFPRMSYGENHNNNKISTFWMGDSKYLRLSELSVNYRLTANLLKRCGVSAMDIQLVGTDLLVWDNVKLWDPELAPSVGQSYPIPSRYAIQLYIHF